jgi:DNA-binding NtrC family response regulator
MQKKSYAVIDVRDKPQYKGDMTLRQKVERVERAIIESAIWDEEGNVAGAARALNTPARTIWDKIVKYQIVPRNVRAPPRKCPHCGRRGG